MKYDKVIEQYIYTTDPFRNGSFGIFAQSEGLSKVEISAMNEIVSHCYSCMPGAFDVESRTFEETRPVQGGSVFSRLFKKTETIRVQKVIKNQVDIVAESHSGNLRSTLSNNADFRANPEKAPFRIIRTKLTDGRTLVCRMAAIGRVYSELDTRQGNLFFHAMVVPAGIELTDKEIANIPFKLGLDKKLLAPNATNPSRVMPLLSMAEITKAPQRQTAQQTKAKAPATQASLLAEFANLTEDKKVEFVIELGLASMRYGKYEGLDGKTRMEYRAALNKIVHQQPELTALAKVAIIKNQQEIYDIAPFKLDALGDVVFHLDSIETSYTTLLSLTAQYIRTSKEIDKLNTQEAWTEKDEAILKLKEAELAKQEEAVQKHFATSDPQKVLTYVSAEMEYEKIHAKVCGTRPEALYADTYYQAARSISRMATKVVTKNIPVEKTTIL